jgi:hypothetical protein
MVDLGSGVAFGSQGHFIDAKMAFIFSFIYFINSGMCHHFIDANVAH